MVNDPFKVLADPIRRGIVERLASGSATVGEATVGFVDEYLEEQKGDDMSDSAAPSPTTLRIWEDTLDNLARVLEA
jgi:DNA-binding transcriptional ArsR family regulator